MTSVNLLVAGNVIVPGQTESHEAYLTNEPSLCHDIVQQ